MTFISSVEAERVLQELGGVPIDRVAWLVIGKGEHYERPERLRMMCFDQAPPLTEIRGTYSGTTQNLAGMRNGYLRVIGYWGRGAPRVRGNGRARGSSGRSSHYWVCMCLCGLFCVHSAKALQRVRDEDDPLMCQACNSEKNRKRNEERREFFRVNGYWPPDERLPQKRDA